MRRIHYLLQLITVVGVSRPCRAFYHGSSRRPALQRASVRLIGVDPAMTDVDLLLENEQLRARIAALEDTIERTEGLCEVLDTGAWVDSLRPRATWLLGLLVAQSCSSFILQDNEMLLTNHPTGARLPFESSTTDQRLG